MTRKITSSFVDDAGAKVEVTVADAQRKWYKFMNVTYTMVAQETFKILRESRLTTDAYILMYWCWDRVRRGNEIISTYDVIGAAIAPQGQKARSRSRVCECFRMLEDLNLLRRESKMILLNPYYQFRGTAEEQNRACDEWDLLPPLPPRPPKVVAIRSRQTEPTAEPTESELTSVG